MKNCLRIGVILILLVSFFGCAGSSPKMRVVPENEVSYAPDQSHALVIFMRPSSFGSAIQSSVFDITTDENKLVGIVSAKKKVAYKAKPGQRLFMVVGETADFMKADLEPGKTYYCLVAPRPGAWKARFSLRPIRKEALDTKKFTQWINSCQFYENTDASLNWAEQNAPSIQSKKDQYLKIWKERPEESNASLLPDDGR